MFDAKKIADAVRLIREAYAPFVRTNTVCDGLTAIIDELDPQAKPLLADAKVGWICEQRNGLYSQIKAFGDSWGTDDCLNPNLFTVFLADNTTRNIYGTYLGTMVNPLPNDIISVEPLAEEGSAEWAWQMLMLQKPVYHPAEGEFQDTYYTKEGFVRCMAKTGWQLYAEPEPAKPEPKPHPIITGYNRLHYIPVDGIKKPGPVMPEPRPLLADAQVGDLCQTRGEGYHLISDVYTDQRKYAYERNCGDTIYVRENGMFNLINHEHPFDIIHTEPLAPEGSAEWAWQMLKLGKPVTNKWVFTAGGYIKDTDSDKYRFVQMWDFFSDWQLYEEKPEPEYKVGDWVKYDIDTYLRVIEASGAKRTLCKTLSGTIVYPYTSCLSKLDPSEVKVTLTLEGTVSRDYDEKMDSFILNHADGHTRNRIKYSTIDPATCTLVKNLLKAQEEK